MKIKITEYGRSETKSVIIWSLGDWQISNRIDDKTIKALSSYPQEKQGEGII